MKDIAERTEMIMCNLDKSQDGLEEMAFELLNAVDHVRTHKEELHAALEVLSEIVVDEEMAKVAESLNFTIARVSRALTTLESLVHKNEEVCAEQRKSIEEAKQAIDFLHCTYDWD